MNPEESNRHQTGPEEAAGRKRLRERHADLIRRLQRGDVAAVAQAQKVIREELDKLAKSASEVRNPCGDPRHTFLDLLSLKGKAQEAAQLVDVLLMDQHGVRR